MTHRLIMFYKCIKFYSNIVDGFSVIERTRFVTDRQMDGHTDRQMDRRKGKTICLPTFAGRHNLHVGSHLSKNYVCTYEFLPGRWYA